jgi:hypothetical protein
MASACVVAAHRGERNQYILVRAQWAGDSFISVLAGTFRPLANEKAAHDLPLYGSVSSKGDMTRLEKSGLQAVPVHRSLLSPHVTIWSLHLFDGELPISRSRAPAVTDKNLLRVLFPPSVAPSVAPVAVAAVPAPPPLDEPSAAETAQVAHEHEGIVPQEGAEPDPDLNLPLNTKIQIRNREENLNDILATEVTNLHLADNLERMSGRVGQLQVDKKGNNFAWITCSKHPKQVFAHQKEAEKLKVILTKDAIVSFLPVPSTKKKNCYTALSIKAVSDVEAKSFPSSQSGSPPTEVQTGIHLTRLTFSQPGPEFTSAFDQQTNATKERIFKLVVNTIREHHYLQEEPIAVASYRALIKCQERADWVPSTLQTAMGHFSSVMGSLDMYCQVKSVRLSKFGSWRTGLRSVVKKTNLHEAKQSAPATYEDIKVMAKRLEHTGRAKLLLIIQWAHAARGKNMLGLRTKNFFSLCQSIKWTEAKTTATRGPYTTHSVYGKFSTFVNKEIDKLSKEAPNQAIFSSKDIKAVKDALKEINPDFDMRSMRRGALQQLARKENKLSAETLMVFSGHTSVKSLYRYLNFGEKFGQQQATATKAAAALFKPAASL